MWAYQQSTSMQYALLSLVIWLVGTRGAGIG